MSEVPFIHKLLSDLRSIDIPVDEVNVFFRPYCKSYWGRYFPLADYDKGLKPKIYIYPYALDGLFVNYSKIFETAVHEFCHHKQYTDKTFKRKSGIMHNTQFWELYNLFMQRAKNLKIV